MIKDKKATTALSKIKNFIAINKNPVIIQTDNGLEFNNNLLKTYLANLNINYVRGSPYHPQNNGCVEAHHKIIKNYL